MSAMHVIRWWSTITRRHEREQDRQNSSKGTPGYLQADAYSVYDAFFKPERGMTEVGCWMQYLDSGVIQRRCFGSPSMAASSVTIS